MSIWGRIFGLEKNPEYELGIEYFNQGKYGLAVEALEKAITDLGPSDPVYALGMFYAAESHVHLGTALFHSGDLDGAFRHFEIAVRENPTYPDLYYRMGVIYHQRGSLEEAVAMLEKAIDLNSSYFEAVCYLGIILHEKGETEDADEVLAKALELVAENPSPISKFLSDHMASRETDIPPLARIREYVKADSEFEICVKDGIEAYNTGDFTLAISAFRDASALHPDYADIRFKLGLSLLRGEQRSEARKELHNALEINESYTEARFYLGIAYLDEKMFREALPHFEQAVREKPGYADLQCYLGATYFYLGEIAKGRSSLEESLRISPHYSKAEYYYGLLLYESGEKEKAIEYLSRGIGDHDKPDNADISLALVHLREDNLEEAMYVLKEILKTGGESADILYFIGDVYMRMKRTGEAEEFFRRSLAINSHYTRAREKLASILIRREEYQQAEELLESNGDNFADLYKIMGDIQFYKGNLGQAETYYRKSLKINSEYSEAIISLALTIRKKGSDKEAEELLRNLLKFDPENVVARNLVGDGAIGLDRKRSL
ncbi:MAG: tetratricopeptide repeat protein [Candidatus Krumholzibacteriota bacterium]|nr:tetratricopeptide repeat protein [Candidatus Krumholzibacteriota bacterium]